MKKVVLIIFCLFLCSCSNNSIKNDIKLSDIYTTSSKIELNVSSKEKDLQYKLYYNNAILANGEANDKIVITNLKKDSEYKLVVYNASISKTKTIKTDDTVILRFGGDTLLSGGYATSMDKNGIDYSFVDVNYLTKGADYTVLNLETSLSLRGEVNDPKNAKYRSDPKYLESFKNAGVDLVTLANDHIMDYGIDAFNDTFSNLDQYKINYIGAGATFQDASKVKYVTINDTKIGFLNASNIIPDDSYIATELTPGVMPLTDKYYDSLYAIIDDTDKKCDTLVLLLHWGSEYNDYPSALQVSLAHSFINKGADIIIGTNSHTLEGIEYYNEGQIFYNIGNFMFDKVNDDSSLSGLFEVEIDKEELISSRVYPITTDNYKVNLLKSSDPNYKKIISSIKYRSSSYNTELSSDGIISKE